MKFLSKKYGPFTGRCWGLFVNFAMNILTIHGAIGYFLKGQSPVEMYMGFVFTVAVCLVLAVPSED